MRMRDLMSDRFWSWFLRLRLLESFRFLDNGRRRRSQWGQLMSSSSEEVVFIRKEDFSTLNLSQIESTLTDRMHLPCLKERLKRSNPNICTNNDLIDSL